MASGKFTASLNLHKTFLWTDKPEALRGVFGLQGKKSSTA